MFCLLLNKKGTIFKTNSATILYLRLTFIIYWCLEMIRYSLSNNSQFYWNTVAIIGTTCIWILKDGYEYKCTLKCDVFLKRWLVLSRHDCIFKRDWVSVLQVARLSGLIPHLKLQYRYLHAIGHALETAISLSARYRTRTGGLNVFPNHSSKCLLVIVYCVNEWTMFRCYV